MDANIIIVKQKPIISYSLLEQVSKEVISKIDALSLDKIEANESMLKTIKTTRTELSKEFKILEEQRKMVKEIVLKDYNAFEDSYKQLIASHYKNADIQLKSLVNDVEHEILDKKISGLKEYFIKINKQDFITFKDMGLKIIKSKSDKSIKEEIETYLLNVEKNLLTINTLEHKDRVLAKYQISKDLNNAISQTNIEVQREDAIKKQNEEREARRLEAKIIADEREDLRQAQQNEDIYIEPQAKQEIQRDKEVMSKTIYKTSFKVSGTKQQLSDLKKYINEKGIKIL